jgi:membrane protein DedA with SNARE-associated domain
MGGIAAIVGSFAAILGVSNSLGYLLPAIIGLESMGIPSPGETALVAAAILASQGKLEIWLVILIGVCSAIVGDNIGYLLGRRYGRTVFTAPGPFMNHRVRAIRAGDGFFERHGPKAVFIGRWIALVRFATAWLAGINHMRFKLFFFWNALGGITWGVTYGLVGYFGGEAAANVLAEAGIIGLVVLLIGPGVIYMVIKRRERRSMERRSETEGSASDRPERAGPGREPGA